MKEEKTKQEIFNQKYPTKKLVGNKLFCVEAIGYLKAIMFYFPNEKEWAETTMAMLMLIIL